MNSESARSMITSYMNQVNSFPLLSAEEEKKLTKEFAETRDAKISKRLVNHNLRLVVKIAGEYRKYVSPDNFIDLIQEGNCGLMRGIEKYNPDGCPLAHYVANWIRAYIVRSMVKNHRLVKIGTTEAQKTLFFNLAKEMAKLSSKGVEFSDADIAKNLSVSEKDVSEMKVRLSGSELISEHRESASLDMIEADGSNPEDAFAEAEERQHIVNVFAAFRSTLNSSEMVVFDSRMNSDEPETFDVIGKRLGVSRQRIQQVESKIKEKFATFSKSAL